MGLSVFVSDNLRCGGARARPLHGATAGQAPQRNPKRPSPHADVAASGEAATVAPPPGRIRTAGVTTQARQSPISKRMVPSFARAHVVLVGSSTTMRDPTRSRR